METVPCPLCRAEHEVHVAKNSRRFVYCSTWNQRVFFNDGAPLEYLKTKGRGRTSRDEEDLELA